MAPRVDWSEDSPTQEGIYTFEIEHAEIKEGKKSGTEYIQCRMRCVDDGSISVFDNLSFSPNAKNIVQAKLSALGLKGQETIEPEDLVGRRIRAAIKNEKGDDGAIRPVVDIKAHGSKAGYFADEEKAKDRTGGINDMDSDVPF